MAVFECHPSAPYLARLAGIGDEAASSLDGQLAALRTLGWRAIELREVAGVAVADLAPDAFARLVESIVRADLTVVGVASRIANWARPITTPFDVDVAELTALAHRCARLGTRLVRVMSYPNDGLPEREWRHRVVRRMRELAARAEQHGLVLAHENCVGWAAGEPSRALELLAAVDSPALRLLFDTGNGLAYGYDSLDMLQPVAEHVVHVHVKDGVRCDGQVEYRVPGTGEANVADCLRLLARHGYQGAWSLEPHLSVQPHRAGRHRGGEPQRDGHEETHRMAGFVASGIALRRIVERETCAAAPGCVETAAGA